MRNGETGMRTGNRILLDIRMRNGETRVRIETRIGNSMGMGMGTGTGKISG